MWEGLVWLGPRELGSGYIGVKPFLGYPACTWFCRGSRFTWHLSLCRDHFIIFSGGMPRASYGDRHCVSVLRAETLVTLDFTSRVIDFFTVHSTQPEDGVYSISLIPAGPVWLQAELTRPIPQNLTTLRP